MIGRLLCAAGVHRWQIAVYGPAPFVLGTRCVCVRPRCQVKAAR